jgi:hypothetical protein
MKEPGYEALYEAAERWTDVALRGEDSLFTPGVAIWAPGPVSDLYSRFVEKPDRSKRHFIEKFRDQIGEAEPRTIQLAGEVIFIHLLIDDAAHGDTKRNLINQVLSWSSEPVSIPDDLAAVLDTGLINPGPSFNVRRPNQLWFILEFIRRWQTLDDDAKKELLADPWQFKELLYSLPEYSAHSQREALLYLVYPDTFEPITSMKIKGRIAEVFHGYIGESDVLDVDERLLRIRSKLGAELKRPTYGYWDPDVHERWNPANAGPGRRGGNGKGHGGAGEEPEPRGISELAEELYLDRTISRKSNCSFGTRGRSSSMARLGPGRHSLLASSLPTSPKTAARWSSSSSIPPTRMRTSLRATARGKTAHRVSS